MRESMRTGWSRRGLLRGGAAIAGMLAMPGCAMAQGRRLGPGDRINVAAIGAGGQGSSNMSALTGENIVAYADVDLGRVSRSLRDKDGAVRPERVALSPDGGEGLEATLRDVIFRGSTVHFYLESAIGPLLAYRQNEDGGDRGLRPGQRVRCSWSPGSAVVVAPLADATR